MILFLDFDGVLHPEPCQDQEKLFCHLPKLEKVLTDFPQVRIVISSTWRQTRTIDSLRDLFGVEIRHRIIGTTPSWHDHPDLMDCIGFQRHAEIEAWLRNSGEPWAAWLAIDDKPYLFQPFLPNLIKTVSSVGFDERVEVRLRSMLAASQ